MPILLGIAGVLIAMLWFKTAPSGKQDAVANAPTRTAEQERKDAEMRTVLAGANWLKKSMKKPETFELVSATMVDGKAICFEYTGRNSFNDKRTSHHVITDNINSSDAKAWNAHCAGRPGVDYTYVRSVMD